MVEQHYRRALSPYLRIAEVIALPLALRGVPASNQKRRVEELLERIGLPGRGDALRHQLSGGEQQRVAFAVALATRPPLLLADEPTGELDATTAESILDVLRDLVRAEGTTCVVVTHDELVERVADRVIHVADGRAVAERIGPPGAPPVQVRDGQGWLAPPLPEPSTPLSPANSGPEMARRPSSSNGQRDGTVWARPRCSVCRPPASRSGPAVFTSSPARRAAASRRCCASCRASTARPKVAS